MQSAAEVFFIVGQSSEEKLKNNGTEKAKQKKLLWAARTMLLPNTLTER